jgi:Chromo (CHRromatin Organisation MOdifier) domain
MLSRRSIRWYTSENDDIKAAVVERFNRTLKERLHRYMTHKNTEKYVDALPDILHSYNSTFHRSIGMAPLDVDEHNSVRVAERLYPPKPQIFKWKLRVGDTVRISFTRKIFRKGYVGNWSEELFTVSALHPTVPVTYDVTDAAGDTIKGRFYEWELQKVVKPADDYYVVEKILKSRRRGGKVEYLVKWRGYPDSMNSWSSDVRPV